MKRIALLCTLFALAVGGALASTASALVVDGIDSAKDFLVVRILPTGDEVILDSFTQTEESEQLIRQITLDFACQERINNPAWVVVIYGPVDHGGWYTADDGIWGSLYNLDSCPTASSPAGALARAGRRP